MKPIVVLVDQDGPLADYRAAILEILANLGQDTALLGSLAISTHDEITRAYGPGIAAEVDRIRNRPGFYEGLGTVRGATGGVRYLISLGMVPVVCTRPRLQNATCASEKLSWLRQHFPEFEERFVLTTDKTLVHGDFLIDDKIEIAGVSRPSWKHVLFGHLDDHDIDGEGPRMGSWDDVSLFRGLVPVRREPREG